MDSGLLGAMLAATIVAGTPLIIVALGQLIAEKSGAAIEVADSRLVAATNTEVVSFRTSLCVIFMF